MLTRRSLVLLPTLLIAFAAPACASDIMVMNAEAPASLTPTSRTAAVYLVLMNHGTDTDVLTGVKTIRAERATPHQTIDDNGVMKMRELKGLELKPHETVTFAPGGNHIMLTGLNAPLKAGETFPLVLTFKTAGDVTIEVQVVQKVSGGEAHEHMETQ